VPHSSTSPFLHVANGTCTTRLIEAARLPGIVSIWADPLYEGPVPGGLTDAELLEVRARYLLGPGEDSAVDLSVASLAEALSLSSPPLLRFVSGPPGGDDTLQGSMTRQMLVEP